ncbi:hypothetical protein THICB1_100224 [Thiomonas arsenitoxydans]|uniref:Uncharacterized protein n=1 Tax=Thiomonas arsenitoxydans (strain DSM 22701 / CIP 110005 / 3As) TaxID=426114 RepID=A0ABP1Z0T0_THIA3|nr:hypothetical protein THICB1_100224 [Thiomonas arsenitoxydans]CQR30814.1 hypothetical protein ACO3_240092 [Thiomonas arsenitoxydans]CQR30829.1 hypothetical protein ACO7_220093 [Thiomonas arsenitoxydans]CQR31772.1 hypothetical protein THICB6_160022 [Thiomonas arsenitoxydans]CQR41463.1 hypothetical protein THICB3110032 [Thiomonas sp. CB3]
MIYSGLYISRDLAQQGGYSRQQSAPRGGYTPEGVGASGAVTRIPWLDFLFLAELDDDGFHTSTRARRVAGRCLSLRSGEFGVGAG